MKHISRRVLRASALAVLVLMPSAIVACVQPPIAAFVPRGPLAVDHLADGTIRVHEPGWFSVELPSAPRIFTERDSTSRGTYVYKGISLQSSFALWSVHYVEYGDPRDLQEALAIVPRRYESSPPPGMHPSPSQALRLDGADGVDIRLRIDPSSSANDAPYPLAARVWFGRQGPRIYQLQCSAALDKATACDRFFDSFRLEAR